MSPLRDKNGNPDLRSFANYGFYGGAGFGALAGVVVAGPHFYEWSAAATFGAVAGCVLLFGIIGHFAVGLAYGSQASSDASFASGDLYESSHGFDGSLVDGGGGDGGGGDGGGGD